MINPFETSSRSLTEPDSVVVGAFSAWNRSLPEFDPGLYSLKYTLRTAGSEHIVSGTYLGNGLWTFEVNSTAWLAGDYTWDFTLIRQADLAESILESGSIRVFLATSDRRDHAQVMVTKITSILENRADSDVGSYTIKSRSITKMTIKELTDWRDYYLAEIGRRPTARGGRRNTLQVKFI